MKAYIAVAPTQATPQPNTPSNDIPINVGTGGAAAAIAIISVVLTKLAGFVDWKELGKQWSGAQTSKTLQSENRKTQEIEAEIDINQGLSETVSTIAQRSVDNTSKITEDLLQLVSGAINSSTANAQSTQALSRASESQVRATEDLINATVHNSQALEALREAVEAIPKETASILEIHAAELRVALNNIDDRLNESNRIKHEGYAAIDKAIRMSELRITEQYTETMAQLRRDFKELVTAVKCPKPE